MNLILHHLRKDICALRVPLAIWIVVMLVAALPDFFIFQPDYEAARAIDHFRDSPITILLGFVAWTILIVRLIQSEPVTGSTSFWLTRPIPRRVYLLSKFAFLGLLVILPGFIPVAAQAYAFGTSAHDFQDQLFAVLLFQLLGALVVIWLATYTPNLMYFGGMLCLGFVGLIILNVLVINVRRNYGGAGSDVAVTCSLVGFFVALVVEHVWRTGRAGFYIGIAFMVVGMTYWVLTPPLPGGYPVIVTSPVNKSVRVDFQPITGDAVTWSHTTFAGGMEVPAAFAMLKPVEDLPDAEICITNVSAHFNVPRDFDGTLSSLGATLTYFNPTEKTAFALVQTALPNIKLAANAYPTERSFNVGLFNLYGVEPDVRDKTGTLTLRINGQALAPRQLAAIPLNDPHYVARVPGGFIRVVPLTSYDDRRTLSIWAIMPQLASNSGQEQLFAVLIDPQKSTGKILQSQGRSSFSTSFIIAGSRRVDDMDISFPLTGTEPLGRMMLYVFEMEPTADFSSKLVVPDFKMTPISKD